MAAVGDIIRVILSQDLGGNLVQNVFHYRLDSFVGSGATDFINDALRSQFLSTVRPAMELVQATSLEYTQIDVQNLNDVAGDEVLALTGTGSAGASAPSLAAYSFQLRPQDKSIRHGRKSIAGINELNVTLNDAGGALLADLVSLGVVFATQLVHPNADFTPVIARIAPASVRPYIPYAVAIAEGLYKGIGSQYSRKQGRGA